MKKIFYVASFFAIAFLLLYTSCKKEENIHTNNSLFKLAFSSDSVSFNTIFTSIGSETRHIKIYNRNAQNINIATLRLINDTQSAFQINVDGQAGILHQNIEIHPYDSMYVFIRVYINPTDESTPFVVEDQLEFTVNNNKQYIKLTAWGQNAHYIVADQHSAEMPSYKIVAGKSEDVTWDKQKPYLIYGYAKIDSNAILRINAGTRLYFHKNSGLWVSKGATLKVNGTLEQPVVFQGDKQGKPYQDIPGQWDRIYINEGSIDNEFNYALIKNAYIGIHAEVAEENMGNTLHIHNSRIQNMTGMGIYSLQYNIKSTNTVISNCNSYLLALSLGGSHDFKHCTFANYWPYSLRKNNSILLSNYDTDTQNQATTQGLQAYFGNCIVDGSGTEELELHKESGALFDFLFDHSAVKTRLEADNASHFANCLINPNNLFVDAKANNFHLTANSPAIDKGSVMVGNEVPADMLGKDRTENPDLGAYEFQIIVN